jgi:hypothetical protein
MIIKRMSFATPGCVGICSVSDADKEHPNKLPFQGVLLVLDKPSNKPPHGAEGHRILVPTSVAKRRLSTLISMGVNYNPDLDGHAVRHKVGVITGAWIEDGKVFVKGFMWRKDFPEVSRDMKAGRLGMSMELSDVLVRTKEEDPWYLEDFHFSGATILFKTAAAYYNTSLSAAARKRVGRSNDQEKQIGSNTTALAAKAALVREEGGRMANEKQKEKVNAAGDQGALLVKAISAAMQEGMKPFAVVLEKQGKALDRLSMSFEELKGLTIAAAADKGEEQDDEQTDDEIKAAKMKADADGDDDDEGDGEDEGKHHKKGDEDDDDDDDDLEAELEHLEDKAADEEPGEVNKDAKNEGDKTESEGKQGPSKSMPIKANRIAASSLVRDLYASNLQMKKSIKTMKAKAAKMEEVMQNKIDALEAQVEQYAERVDRKSVSAEVTAFLAKGGVDLRDLRAEGRKLSVTEVDGIFASSPVQLDPTTRMWFKNQLLEAGVMEQGEIHRGM